MNNLFSPVEMAITTQLIEFSKETRNLTSTLPIN